MPPANAAALARAMVTVLRDARARAAMGEAARARIVRDFSVAARMERLLALYDTLLQPGQRATDLTHPLVVR